MIRWSRNLQTWSENSNQTYQIDNTHPPLSKNRLKSLDISQPQTYRSLLGFCYKIGIRFMIDILGVNNSTRNYLVYYTHSNSRIKRKQELLFWIELKVIKIIRREPNQRYYLSIGIIYRITKHIDLNRIRRLSADEVHSGVGGDEDSVQSCLAQIFSIWQKPRLRITTFQLKILFGVIYLLQS